MHPITHYEPCFSDRVLIAINPLWKWFARRFPSAFAVTDGEVPHPSAMLTEPNWLWRLIFPRFFKRISSDDAEIERLSAAASESSIVYVTKLTGQLEYNFFNHLFIERTLPLAEYTNALTLRRWMKSKDLWRSIAAQENEITIYGRPIDPMAGDSLVKMIESNRSALINIPQSYLEDDAILFAGPMQAIASLIKMQRTSARPISIVPLDFLWSRRPEGMKKSVIDILFGEKESPGRIRKIVLFWRNYKRRAQASIGAPINLKALLEKNAGTSDEEVSRIICAELLSALKAQRRTITGPPIRPRSWFIQEVMADEALDRSLCRLAEERGDEADNLRELALRYIRSIAADLDYTYVELLERILDSTLIRLFDAFDVNAEGLARTKSLFEKGPVVFVPNHRSHADYLLLSHVLYHHGMTVPFIAAGANLSFWPLGHIFRRCGAFFMRRSFRDNIVYRNVLTTYLKILLKEGHSQEFFIEGSRSRTGKLKYPKKGMLRMLLNASRDARIENLKFVPVSITYDRVIEHKSYVRELEGGKKEDEKPSHLIRLAKYISRRRERYGTIYIRFGEPISISESSENTEQVKSLAFNICHEINRHTVATPAAVAAASLLCVARAGVTETEFERNSLAILACLISKGVEVPQKLIDDPKTMLRGAITKMAAQKLITARPSSLEPFIALEEKNRLPLSCFRNVIVHYFVTVGIISQLIGCYSKLGRSLTIDELTGDIVSFQRILHHEFRFATRLTIQEHVKRTIDFLCAQRAISCSEDGRVTIINSGAWVLDIFSSQVRPFVETLWVAARYTSEKMSAACEERALIDEMMRAGLDMFMLGRMRFRESVTKEGFANAIYALKDCGAIIAEPQKTGTKRRNIYLPSPDPTNAQKLKVELERLL